MWNINIFPVLLASVFIFLFSVHMVSMVVLLSVCACCCRFVSDYGPEGYNCVCQYRLIQALQHLDVGPENVRTYPPCLLEWTANRKKAYTVLHIHCFDGKHTNALMHT